MKYEVGDLVTVIKDDDFKEDESQQHIGERGVIIENRDPDMDDEDSMVYAVDFEQEKGVECCTLELVPWKEPFDIEDIITNLDKLERWINQK